MKKRYYQMFGKKMIKILQSRAARENGPSCRRRSKPDARTRRGAFSYCSFFSRVWSFCVSSSFISLSLSLSLSSALFSSTTNQIRECGKGKVRALTRADKEEEISKTTPARIKFSLTRFAPRKKNATHQTGGIFVRGRRGEVHRTRQEERRVAFSREKEKDFDRLCEGRRRRTTTRIFTRTRQRAL